MATQAYPLRRSALSTKHTRRVAGWALSYLILAFFVIAVIFPVWWMIRTALVPIQDTFSLRPTLVPATFTLDHLYRVITSPSIPFVQFFRNTALVSFVTTVLVVIAGAGGAYALARLKFRGERFFALSLLFIKMFPGVLLVIPLYEILSRLRLVNSFWGLALAYATINLPFVVWLLRGYFAAIPVELEDAARVDGCTYYGALWRIVLPLTAPGLVATAALTFINSWNEFLLAYVLINDDNLKMLSTGLVSYTDQFTSDYNGLFAMATLTTLPVVVLFMVFQRWLVGGLTAGSVKG